MTKTHEIHRPAAAVPTACKHAAGGASCVSHCGDPVCLTPIPVPVARDRVVTKHAAPGMAYGGHDRRRPPPVPFSKRIDEPLQVDAEKLGLTLDVFPFRQMRLWHWRHALRASAKLNDKRASPNTLAQAQQAWSFHMGAVQALNELFPNADTAEMDGRKAAEQARRNGQSLRNLDGFKLDIPGA